jgi:hypothetical protein
VRLLAALVLPPLLTLAIAAGAIRMVGGLSATSRTHTHGIVWGKRTFVSRAALGRWLESRGRSAEAWERRHPAGTAKADAPADHGSSPLLLGGIAVLAVGGLALLGRRRRPRPPLRRHRRRLGRPSLSRPRLGPSYARAQPAALLVWRQHPDLAWYVAGGALAVGAGLLVAGWG